MRLLGFASICAAITLYSELFKVKMWARHGRCCWQVSGGEIVTSLPSRARLRWTNQSRLSYEQKTPANQRYCLDFNPARLANQARSLSCHTGEITNIFHHRGRLDGSSHSEIWIITRETTRSFYSVPLFIHSCHRIIKPTISGLDWVI